jgi:CHASE2 domain-containing sensor protein
MTYDFVIIARGGALIKPYVSLVKLSDDDPDWHRTLEEDPSAEFDDWCNWELNDMVDELEQNGASAVVLSLEEYRNLPKH